MLIDRKMPVEQANSSLLELVECRYVWSSLTIIAFFGLGSAPLYTPFSLFAFLRLLQNGPHHC